MKAVRITAPGTQPRIESVAEPTVTDPWDVIVRVGGAGLCRTDVHIMDGLMPGMDYPLTIGHENAGWIEALGSGVRHLSVGDAVVLYPQLSCGFCLPCRRGDDMFCTASGFSGITVDGGMAELVKTTARAVVKLPAGVEPVDVAAHADAGLTAYHAVKKALPQLVPGSSVVVVGAGGVGHIAIQCLKAMTAARVIVVDPRKLSLDLAAELGADEVVSTDGDPVARVRELTGGAGATAVLDFVGEGGAEKTSNAMVGPAGTHYVVGYGGTIDLGTLDLVMGEHGVSGCRVGTYLDLVELMELVVAARLPVHVETYPLDAVGDAVADLRAGRLRGRAVLVP